MNEADPVPRSAAVQVPPWLWGADPSKYFDDSKIQSQVIDDRPGWWRIQTSESWRRARPSLVTVTHLAGPMRPRARLDFLKDMADGDLSPLASDHVLIGEINRLGERAERTGDHADAFAYSQLRVTAVTPDDVPEEVENVYQNLISVGMTSDPDDKVFANAGVHVIRRTPELVHRLKLPSVWLRGSFDEQLGRGDLRQIQAMAAIGETVFASSEGLYDGIYTLDAYIAPLLGALSPAIWSFPAIRALGIIVFTLGQPIAGTRGTAAELLQILPNQGVYESISIPTLSANASTDAINWWTCRVNDMFAVLADPAVFTDRAGSYVATKHMQDLLTVEQLFRRVFSIQTTHRDANARRTLLFTVLDTLERLTGWKLPTLCSLPFARKKLQALAAQIPSGAAEVLLPNAQRAVAALERLQDGFFIKRHTGADGIEWNDPLTGITTLTPEDAAAQYIQVLRDATHGHGSNKAARVARTSALLTHHNGHIPHDLGLLGYLYLLDLMSRPGDLRKRLYRSGQV